MCLANPASHVRRRSASSRAPRRRRPGPREVGDSSTTGGSGAADGAGGHQARRPAGGPVHPRQAGHRQGVVDPSSPGNPWPSGAPRPAPRVVPSGLRSAHFWPEEVKSTSVTRPSGPIATIRNFW
jgi:hypothetical protein